MWGRSAKNVKSTIYMLINGILYNSEVWHGLRNIDIANFDAIDKYLLRGVINLHAKVPIEHPYLEMGVLPLLDFISARRLREEL